MKKFMAILAIVALVGMAGCCTSPNNPNKTFGNCVAKVIKPVKSILCPPNQEQVDQAAAAVNFLLSLAGKDYTAAVSRAEAIFVDIANKICVGLDQLQAAIDTFDSTAAVVKAEAKMKGVASVTVPDVSALRMALKK